MINARVDVFLPGFISGAGPGTKKEFVAEAVRRARAYLEAGADCVYPIALWEAGALRQLTSEINAPIDIMRLPEAPPLAELAALGCNHRGSIRAPCFVVNIGDTPKSLRWERARSK